jgi:hypothetical protein
VHVDCGVAAGVTVTAEDILAAMKINDLAVVSLVADMGNGEVRDAVRDLPKIDGKDFALSTPGRIVHWDAEWHFDPHCVTFDEKAIGGHLVLLGLKQGARIFPSALTGHRARQEAECRCRIRAHAVSEK